MDPFTANKLTTAAIGEIADGCKEFGISKDVGPILNGQIKTERSISFNCRKAEKLDPACMECPFLRGKEFSA